MARKRKASDELYNQRRRLKRQLEKAAKAEDVAEYERLAAQISATYQSIQHQAIFEQSAREVSFKPRRPGLTGSLRGVEKKLKREVGYREDLNAAEAIAARLNADVERKRRQQEIDKAQVRHKQLDFGDFSARHPEEAVNIFMAATRDIWDRPDIAFSDRFEVIKDALGATTVQDALDTVFSRADVQKAMRALLYLESGMTDSTLAEEFSETPMPDDKYVNYYFLQFVL